MPDIQICPVKKLYQIAMEADLQECAAVLVSSYEIREEKLTGLPCYLAMGFDDVAAGSVNGFQEADGLRIKRFVDSLPAELDTLFVCCDSGESRSSAMAAAIMRYWGLEEMRVWRNPGYHPNPGVYRVLCGVLGVGVTGGELEEKLAVNAGAFSKAKQSLANC